MYRDLLAQGRQIHVPSKNEKKKQKPKKAVVPVCPSPSFNKNVLFGSKVVFVQNRLEYHPREDKTVTKWTPDDWSALKKMAELTKANLDHAIQELNDELKRLQGRIVLTDYNTDAFVEKEPIEKKRKIEEDSDTGGSCE